MIKWYRNKEERRSQSTTSVSCAVKAIPKLAQIISAFNRCACGVNDPLGMEADDEEAPADPA